MVKDKFILPLFPRNKKSNRTAEAGSLFLFKIVSENFQELLVSSISTELPLIIDAGELARQSGVTTARKKWRRFQKQNPQFKDSILVLNFENVLEIFKNEYLIVDLNALTDVTKFHFYLEWTLNFQQFSLLSKNQATGFSHFWKHQKNCWITDLDEKSTSLKATAKKFFKNENINLQVSAEEKMNELSRVYAKLLQGKVLTYTESKASAS